MNDLKEAMGRLHAELGYKSLNPMWAKVEIVLGLMACAVGIFTLIYASHVLATGRFEIVALVTGIVVFVLGGYLSLAGHRSHFYQSLNNHTAYLMLKFSKAFKGTNHD